MKRGGRMFSNSLHTHTHRWCDECLCDSRLSSEPIYTSAKGSAASPYCLKRHAPAGEDGGISEAEKETSEDGQVLEQSKDVKGAGRRLRKQDKGRITDLN